jgi:ABC-type branched-subunit amino acid transport system substrate-binding protein
MTVSSQRSVFDAQNRTDRFNLLSILPLTTDPVIDGMRVPIDFRIDIEVSGWLAYYHYTNRSSNTNNVLPHIQERLAQCNVDFYYSMRDSSFSPINAAREFLDAYGTSSNNDVSSNDNKTMYPDGSLLDDLQEILDQSTKEQREAITRPNAVIGASASVTSSAIGYIASSLLIPQISSSSTAKYLNNKDIYPTFSRTVPTNQGDAKAMALFLEHLQITHVGILFINDAYGNDFHSDLVRELYDVNIIVFSYPYDNMSAEQSINQLATSQQKYVIAILNASTWQNVLKLAYEYNIIGQPDYFWLFGESSLQFGTSSFQLDRETESDYARALHGTAVLAITAQPYEPLDTARLDFSDDKVLQQLYISQHDEPEIFTNYTFPKTDRSIYRYFTYDAVVAMMLAVCESSIDYDNDTASGRKIYEQLLRTKFLGVSGSVSFDPATGTRETADILYGVWNIQFPDELISNGTYKVLPTLTTVINLTNSASQVETLAPLYFASNTTVPPPPLPPAIIDMNLIPSAIRAFCLSLGGLVIVMSMWWILWTYINRDKDVVKASQPIFLCQICIGTIIIASAVVPMSMQEPVSELGLDISCMATPWLISVGFVTAFSALFTKTWRLNKLFKNSRNLRRVVIRPRHVVLPFVILMILNIAVMLAWTVEAPLVWHRQLLDSYDKFGRSIESIGKCTPSENQHSVIYLSLIVVINISVLLFATYQAYVARNLPSEYSESTYITIAMGSLLEVFVLGIPLLFLASSDPSTNFSIRSILVVVTCLSVLLPIFLPKFVQRNMNKRYHDAVVATTGSAPVQSRVKITMGVTAESGGKHGATSNSYEQSNHVTDAPQNRELKPGLSAVRRNQDYFKEQHAAKLQKTASNNIIGSWNSFKPKASSSAESRHDGTLPSNRDENIPSSNTISSHTVFFDVNESP